VARLLEAPKESPDDWQMVPSPRGPKGRGYLSIVAGLGIPKGAPDQERTKELIKALCNPDIQLRVLADNGFFPVVDADLSGELPPAARLEAEAVAKTEAGDGALLALPPIGLGDKDGQMSDVYKDAFTAIVLKDKDIRKTLDGQAKVMQSLIDGSGAACWAPDPPSSGPCKVG
jgi:multiple sugar transport system substrate-binding protein